MDRVRAADALEAQNLNVTVFEGKLAVTDSIGKYFKNVPPEKAGITLHHLLTHSSGIVSDLFPHVRECMDDVCLINSMRGDHNDHFQATLGIHTGSVTFARPSIGSWVSYGLGTENQNLPAFVVLAPHLPYAGTQVWSSDFLPVAHQGTRVLAGPEPIPDLTRRSPSSRRCSRTSWSKLSGSSCR